MNTNKTALYQIANALCHTLHIAIISFIAIGWLFSTLRLLHLIVLGLTLLCWFVLGLRYGFGYCPITDWHWKLKDKWGDGRPPTSYIHAGLEHLLSKLLKPASVDATVLMGTIGIAFVATALFLIV